MSRRSRARQVAFQVLYQDDLNPRSNPAVSDELIKKRLRSEELIEFSRSLVTGVRHHCQEMDKLIEQVAENWSLKRMAATDRNVLRLGAFEILYTETPARVVIDEAVELAKRFGSNQSAQFVNGILDKLMHTKSGEGIVESGEGTVESGEGTVESGEGIVESGEQKDE